MMCSLALEAMLGYCWEKASWSDILAIAAKVGAGKCTV